MNTITSDMASFSILCHLAPIGFDLIGDLFDLTICITSFAAPI